MSIKKLAEILKVSIERNTQYIEPRIMVISLIAIISFPLYYVIWHYIFPQPYENLGLRLFGCMLFIPYVFVKHWPQKLRRFKAIYWYIATLYTLPFFFFFMLLKNDGSAIWFTSTLVAIFLMLLWLDWINVIIHSVLGVILAWGAYFYSTDSPHLNFFTQEQIPIYAFAVIVGIASNISAERLRQERLLAMQATASNIAHELRTPLLGIKSGAAGLSQYLPVLLDAYKLAREHGIPVEPIRLVHINSMYEVLKRIEGEADHSNAIIDMLMMNIQMNSVTSDIFSVCSIVKCIETAIQRYHFASEKESCLIRWEKDTDFNFRGIELLMVHVLFNLIKNSIYQIAKAGKGEIFINLKTTRKGNVLVFKDTGAGVPPEVLPHIFTRFYSWSSDSDRGQGAGIGLAFCRSVMNSFGGAITCTSQFGEYTEFTLKFPIEA